MTEFQAGQKIRATSDTRTWGGVDIPKGTVATVESRGWDDDGTVSDGFDVAARVPGVDHSVLVNPDAFTDAALDPSKVKAGDTVTLTRGKASVTDEVKAISSGGVVRPWFGFLLSEDDEVDGRRAVYADGEPREGWALTDHQPAPGPDYRGQFVTIHPEGDKGVEWFGFIDNDGDFYGLEDGFLRDAAQGDYTVVRTLGVS